MVLYSNPEEFTRQCLDNMLQEIIKQGLLPAVMIATDEFGAACMSMSPLSKQKQIYILEAALETLTGGHKVDQAYQVKFDGNERIEQDWIT